MCDHLREHIIIIVLKDKIQLYEIKDGRPQILYIDAKEYLHAPVLSEAVVKIKEILSKHYKKDSWSCFKITVIYEKYNIETLKLFFTNFKECAKLDYISAETLIAMNQDKLTPSETGIVKFGESFFELESIASRDNEDDRKQLVPIDSCDRGFGEVSSKDIALFTVSGGSPSVMDSGRLNALEAELEHRREELKSKSNENKELSKKIIALDKQNEELNKKIEIAAKESLSNVLYKKICAEHSEFDKLNKYIELVVKDEIDPKKISYDSYLKGKRPSGSKNEKNITIKLGHKLYLEMVYIEPGEFIMGSKNCGEAAAPPHEVTITKGFYMGKYTVTNEQWAKISGSNSNDPKNTKPDHPVVNVSWEDCKEFIEKLNELKKYNGTFRLPTEAEWEYACRAGSTTEYYWGNDIDDAYYWYDKNSGSSTQPVGKKKPNNFGLYDMSGNVWEWCEDFYDRDWYNKESCKSEENLDPTGPNTGSDRVLRGGGWPYGAGGCCSAFRNSDYPSGHDSRNGFRLALPSGQ